jgi:hypothetical protein
VVLQLVALAQAKFPGQAIMVADGQPVVVPEQEATVTCALEQVAGEHRTVFAAGLQSPDPLQPPAMQLLLDVGQVVWGSWPVGTAVQVPIDVPMLQALQPLHMLEGLSQQTPSTQLPLVHSPPLPQLRPSGLVALQAPALQ